MWANKYRADPRRSFNEELELYKLLDFDAEGEIDEDLDVGFDDSTGETMVS